VPYYFYDPDCDWLSSKPTYSYPFQVTQPILYPAYIYFTAHTKSSSSDPYANSTTQDLYCQTGVFQNYG
jgi:hypothetical protein